MIHANANLVSTGLLWLPPGLCGVRPLNKRIHDQERFFKYTSIDGAICALTMRTLRWSSPLTFNDPFDVPRELSFGLTPEVLVKAFRLRLAELVRNPPDDTSQLEPEIRLLVEIVKRGIPEEERQASIDRITDDSLDPPPSSKNMDAFREYWRRSLPEFRILCLCEKPDNEVMWAHYAKEYKGVVLEFECSEERDSPWIIARKVNYSASKPDVYTAEGWAKFLTLEPETGVRAILDDATYNKSEKWSYEQEWRITSHMKKGDTGRYSDYPFAARDLVGVHLGPKMEFSDRDAICKLVRDKPYIRVYDTELRHDRSIAFIERNVTRN